jgi:hypothetical protein
MRARHMIAVLVVGGAAGLAIAQVASKRTLHQDISPPTTSQPDPRTIGGSNGGMPAAIKAGDKIIPKPALTDPDKAPKDEPVLGAGGFGADRDTQMKPDDQTGPDDTLRYVSVFNPDVLPFKRMSAFEAVADDYLLKVGRTALVEVPVGGVTDNTKRDYFRASVLLKLEPGKDVPLPSVAPDMRILSYETKPKVTLKFEKDGADNFYVRTDESGASGTFRLIFDCDADANYFAPSLPNSRHYTARQIATMTPPEIKPVMPAKVRVEAQRTLDKLGLDPDMDIQVSFNKLVDYFRAFEAKTLPPTSGDIYRDLCDSQAGVCRHRSFAFMITANALGFPTRYVQNEAHAFVEVWFPERSWQRIDLGGAALRMEVSGADDKTLHRPRAEDPFSKPSQYKDNYTQLEGDISGLTKQQIDDKRKPLDQAPSSGAVGPGSGGGGSGGGLGSGGPNSNDAILPDITLPPVTMDPKKQNPKLEITKVSASAYRGGTMHVEAKAYIEGSNAPLAGHPIDIFIAPQGSRGSQSKLLGRATTGADGTFRQDFTVPSALDLATYEVHLSAAPDAYYNAALSDP